MKRTHPLLMAEGELGIGWGRLNGVLRTSMEWRVAGCCLNFSFMCAVAAGSQQFGKVGKTFPRDISEKVQKFLK